MGFNRIILTLILFFPAFHSYEEISYAIIHGPSPATASMAASVCSDTFKGKILRGETKTALNGIAAGFKQCFPHGVDILIGGKIMVRANNTVVPVEKEGILLSS